MLSDRDTKVRRSRVSADVEPRRPEEPANLPALVLRMQQAQGNQAVQRLVSTLRPAPRAVLQRRVAILPAHYAAGLNVDPANLTPQQLAQYLQMAVLDDYNAVRRSDTEKTHHTEWQRLWDGVKQQKPMQERLVDLGLLITSINDFQDTDMQTYAEKYTAEGKGAVIGQPNRDTRYATTPKTTDYKHSKVTAEPPKWGTDKDMWGEFGTGLAPVVDNLATVEPRVKTNKPLLQLPWAAAKKLLPRPLLNLIFDVRFQLESAGAVVIDERTPYEKQRKEKSPSAPGTQRSWHQDSPGVLPPNQFGDGVPEHGTALHAHYGQHSQSGAGSSIGEGVKTPQGYAEYTGTGSNWEHNTKVVLDYVQKKVYLTLTHYQYWALIEKQDGGHEFWPTGTQAAEGAEGVLESYLKETKRAPQSATLMSPWMEVLVT